MIRKEHIARVLLLLIIGILLFFLLRFNGKEHKTSVSSILPTNTSIPKQDTVESITEVFSKKYQLAIEAFDITVDKDLGNYAKGSVRQKSEMGGGLWFAAKVDGNWQLVFAGNGIITCTDLQPFPNFPTSLVPECFDETNDIMIKR